MGEHRVPLLGSGWRRNDDPATSRDPRVRAVVGALATLPAPELRADFRAELRAQLVAITPRIVSEAAESGPMIEIVPARAATAAPARPRPTPHGRPAANPTKTTTTSAPSTRTGARHADDGVLARLRGIHFGRPLTVAASVIVALALVLGGAVVMSRKALPGDALYGLKRASESLELATAGSDVDKAKDYLHFAANRAGEAKALSKQAGDAENAHLIVSTLKSSDTDVRSAARLLGTDAVKHRSVGPLTTMTAWAPAQLQRLKDLAASLTDPGLRAQALSSIQLVRAAQARAVALSGKMSCGCLSATNADALGPKPCSACSVPVTNPHKTTAPNRGHTAGNTHPHKGTKGANGGSSHQGGGTVTTPKASGSPTPSGAPPSKSHPIGLPSLPTGSLPALPVTVNPTCVSASLPILGGVGVGLCNGVNVNVGG